MDSPELDKRALVSNSRPARAQSTSTAQRHSKATRNFPYNTATACAVPADGSWRKCNFFCYPKKVAWGIYQGVIVTKDVELYLTFFFSPTTIGMYFRNRRHSPPPARPPDKAASWFLWNRQQRQHFLSNMLRDGRKGAITALMNHDTMRSCRAVESHNRHTHTHSRSRPRMHSVLRRAWHDIIHHTDSESAYGGVSSCRQATHSCASRRLLAE